jgi:hypothetical protein
MPSDSCSQLAVERAVYDGLSRPSEKPVGSEPQVDGLERPSYTSSARVDRLVPYRVAVGFLLASLLWKLRAFTLCYQIYAVLPLEDTFFPSLLRDNLVLGLSYLVPVVLSAIALVARERAFLRIQSLITCAGMLVLCVHQGTYNDVTFLTSWWTSLWCVWYVTRLDDPIGPLAVKGVFLAQLILSVIFLGGAAGKWTHGYWSGEVFYDIYFVDRDFWLFNLLRGTLDAGSLRDLATWYSRFVIVTESACALLWLLPGRWAFPVSIAVVLGIALLSNFYLFSVVFCLVGLAVAGLNLLGQADADVATA